MTGKFIKINKYDFTDANGKRIKGQNMSCLVDDDIVKVNLSDDEYKFIIENGIDFADDVALDVRVKGKYANYILAV